MGRCSVCAPGILRATLRPSAAPEEAGGAEGAVDDGGGGSGGGGSPEEVHRGALPGAKRERNGGIHGENFRFTIYDLGRNASKEKVTEARCLKINGHPAA